MGEWTHLERLCDEDLVDALLAASVPELAQDRERIVEIFRQRFAHVADRLLAAYKASQGVRAAFPDYLWTFGTLRACFASYRRNHAEGALEAYLRTKIRWKLRTFFKQHAPKLKHIEFPDPAVTPSKRPEDDAADVAVKKDERHFRLDAIRGCAEKLVVRLRVPFKLVHANALTLNDDDWRFIVARTRRKREALEADLAKYRAAAASLTLEQAGLLVHHKLHTVGTYVDRARDQVARCVRWRTAWEGAPL